MARVHELTRETADSLAGEMLDSINDRYVRDKLREGGDRRHYGILAANIADDRYSAGSSAAVVACYLVLAKGVDVARDFIADLDHHESAR